MASSEKRSRSGRGKEQRAVSSGTVEVSWHGSVATLFLNGVESSCVDVERPEHLEFEYMQHMDAACRVFVGADVPLRAVHVGGAAAALPWSWSLTHPRSRQVVAEIDQQMIDLVRDWFDLPRAPELKMRCEDGRRTIDGLRAGSVDVIVRDAFADGVVPAHLATLECAAAAARALRPGGVYLVNAAHGGGADARRELEALARAFEYVCAVFDPKVGKGGRRGNVVFVCFTPPHDEADTAARAQQVEDAMVAFDRELRRLPLPARMKRGAELRKWQAEARSPSDAEVGWALPQQEMPA